jgi:hypothetical protein
MIMRIRGMHLKDLTYNYTDYSSTLYESVKRIGFSFPLTVRQEGDQYVVIDGHKRCSILEDLLKEDPAYKRGDEVYVVVKNNGDERSNDCSRGRNTH